MINGQVHAKGRVLAVNYLALGRCEAYVEGCFRAVPEPAADVALAAKRGEKEIEIVEGDGTWQSRTVRIVPVVVVKARGRVRHVYANGPLGVYSDGDNGNGWMRMECPKASDTVVAARAMADDAEVEIVSVDGGPDMVRRVSL